jgi:predicted HicB family RNase H-like nuclease
MEFQLPNEKRKEPDMSEQFPPVSGQPQTTFASSENRSPFITGQPQTGTTGQPQTESPLATKSFLGDRKKEAYRIADQLFNQNPDWVTFFREVLGVGGVIRRLFPEPKALFEFEQSEEYAEVQQMVAKLREKSDVSAGDKEPTRVITVRLPASLHDSLKAEAHDRQTSMNKLCITKLLQVIDEQIAATQAALQAKAEAGLELQTS